MLHFGNEEENAVGIIGSSNFTKQGMSGNLELNQVEDNNATVNYIRKIYLNTPLIVHGLKTYGKKVKIGRNCSKKKFLM